MANNRQSGGNHHYNNSNFNKNNKIPDVRDGSRRAMYVVKHGWRLDLMC